jgi:hypothetical protein
MPRQRPVAAVGKNGYRTSAGLADAMFRSFRAGHGARSTVAPSGSVSSSAARRYLRDAGYIDPLAPAASLLLFMSNLAPITDPSRARGALERASSVTSTATGFASRKSRDFGKSG